MLHSFGKAIALYRVITRLDPVEKPHDVGGGEGRTLEEQHNSLTVHSGLRRH